MYIHIFLSFISLVILVNIYVYLDSIKNCQCFVSNSQGETEVDVEFLKFYQILEIISLFIFLSLVYMHKKQMSGGKKMYNGVSVFMTLSLFVLMFISGYVSYNSFLFYQNVNNNCLCANKWQQYFVYLQGVFNSVYFLRLCYTLVLVLLMILTGFKL
jgi:hypothetical protein